MAGIFDSLRGGGTAQPQSAPTGLADMFGGGGSGFNPLMFIMPRTLNMIQQNKDRQIQIEILKRKYESAMKMADKLPEGSPWKDALRADPNLIDNWLTTQSQMESTKFVQNQENARLLQQEKAAIEAAAKKVETDKAMELFKQGIIPAKDKQWQDLEVGLIAQNANAMAPKGSTANPTIAGPREAGQLQQGQTGADPNVTRDYIAKQTNIPDLSVAEALKIVADPSALNEIMTNRKTTAEERTKTETIVLKDGLPHVVGYNSKTGKYDIDMGLSPPKGGIIVRDPVTGNIIVDTTGGKSPTVQQMQWQSFYQRGSDANQILGQTDAALTDLLSTMAGKFTPDFVSGYLQKPEYKQALQASENFINSALRPDTGAAYSAEELATYARMYMPRPGDSLEQIKIKANARQVLLDANRNAQGKLSREELDKIVSDAQSQIRSSVISVPGSSGVPDTSTNTGPPSFNYDKNGNRIK